MDLASGTDPVRRRTCLNKRMRIRAWKMRLSRSPPATRPARGLAARRPVSAPEPRVAARDATRDAAVALDLAIPGDRHELDDAYPVA